MPRGRPPDAFVAGVELRVLPGVGHLAPLEAPAEAVRRRLAG
jgi:pimeloyl-ACP methyl ester carboxylesterase